MNMASVELAGKHPATSEVAVKRPDFVTIRSIGGGVSSMSWCDIGRAGFVSSREPVPIETGARTWNTR
jgi:hypothetical protein